MSSLFALFASLLVVVLLSSIVEARVYKKHYEFGRRIQNWKVAKVVKPHRHHGTINTRVRPTRRHLLDEKSMLSNEVDFFSKISILSTSYSYQYADKTTSSSSSTVNVRLVPTKTIRSTSYSSLPSAPIMTNINREVQAYASLSDMEGTTNSTKHQTSVEIRSNIVVVVIVFGLSFVILFMYLLCRKKEEKNAPNYDNHVV